MEKTKSDVLSNYFYFQKVKYLCKISVQFLIGAVLLVVLKLGLPNKTGCLK